MSCRTAGPSPFHEGLSVVAVGVSNWGGYALACALYVLNTCEVHGRYLRKAPGPSRSPGEQSWTQALPSVAKVTPPAGPWVG